MKSGTTPARAAREADKRNAANEKSRLENEAKYTGFKMGCDEGAVEACCSLGEWYVLMRKDYDAAAELYTSACLEKHHAQSCVHLGALISKPCTPTVNLF
jgi:TPR repeat protein